MTKLRTLPSLAACLLLLAFSCVLPRLAAQGLASFGMEVEASEPPSHAETLSAVSSIAPGQPFHVAVRVVLGKDYHTYWTNPGTDTGYQTTLEFTLPQGFSAGPTVLSPPRLLNAGDNGMLYGYEHESFASALITPPATLKPGDRVTLKATLAGLSCDKSGCVPMSHEVSWTFPVAASAVADTQAAATIAKVLDAQPVPTTAWTVSGVRKGNQLLIDLTPGAGAAEIKDAYYFDAKGLSWASDKQVFEKTADGYRLTVALNADAAAKTFSETDGLLRTSGSWLDKGTVPDIAVRIAPPTGYESISLFLLGSALLGGLILNIMPCVFPVLGLKVMGFVSQAGESRRKVLTHGLVFTLGVLVSFWILSGLLLLLRASGKTLGWGFQLQEPGFLYFLAALMFIFGLSMAGVFEVGENAVGVGSKLSEKSGYKGSFFSGILATLVSTPCAAPFLGPALGSALKMQPVESMLMFTCIAIGLALPYLVFSAFPALIDRLPRPGPWMESFKQFMSFPLFATAAWLLWSLTKMEGVEPITQLLTMFSICGFAMACWIFGRWGAPWRSRGLRRTARIGAVALVALFAFMGWPRVGKGWEAWSPARQEQLLSEGRPVYVDFTASWCATCQVNKLVAYSDEVNELAERKGIVFLKADWTNRDDTITRELAKYGKAAVPVNVLLVPGQEPHEFPNILTPGILVEQFEKLPDRK